MKIMTGSAEVGLVVRSDGGYELALYHRDDDRMIRFEVDATLAWAISGAVRVPVTAEEVRAV